MGRKVKYSQDVKVKACEEYINGIKSAIELSKELRMGKRGSDKILHWSKRYQKYGVAAFEESAHNKSYSTEFKLLVVNEYNHGMSLNDLTVKYGIPSSETIRRWVLKYNRHEELKDYTPKPEVYDMNARKTTIEERIEIVNWCLEHDKNYKETASIFNCSYTQVYQWVNKYLENGEDGLSDKRGKRKTDEELSDTEKLNREIDKLKRLNKELERENKMLKKLNALDWK